MLALIACTTSLSAQITREQADKIVWKHIQNEVTIPYLLYAQNDTPGAEGLMITTYHEETVKVKYACWAYYLNENPGVNEPVQHRYLFVKEDDRNLLEIITSNDLVPDLTGCEPVLGSVNVKKEFISIYPNPTTGVLNLIQGIAGQARNDERENITLYPNPTTGELEIKNYELGINSIEVFDVFGRKVSSHHLITSSSHQHLAPNFRYLFCKSNYRCRRGG